MSVEAVIEQSMGLDVKLMETARAHPDVLRVDAAELLPHGCFRYMLVHVATAQDADNIFGKTGATSPWGTRIK